MENIGTAQMESLQSTRVIDALQGKLLIRSVNGSEVGRVKTVHHLPT